MKKWVVLFVVLAILGAIVAFILLKKEEKKRTKVTLGMVSRGKLSLKVRARARIEAAERIELKAKRGGVITFISEEGTKIKEGEIIALLDDKELLAKQKEYSSQLLNLTNELERLKRGIFLKEVEKRKEQARVSYEELHRQFLSTQRLFEKKIVSEDTFKRISAEDERAKISLSLAELQLQEAKTANKEREKEIEAQIISIKASLSFIEQQIGWSKISSPINGIIIYKMVKEGTFVQPSQILLTLAETEHFVVKSDIDETEISKILCGMKTLVLPDAFPDKTISGIITKIAPSPILQTKVNTFEVTAKLEKTNVPIKSEMLCDLIILSKERDNVLKLPYEAILTISGKDYVFVVEKNIAFKKEVSLGLVTPNEVEVLSGVDEGENIILNPPLSLKDKEKIRIK